MRRASVRVHARSICSVCTCTRNIDVNPFVFKLLKVYLQTVRKDGPPVSAVFEVREILMTIHKRFTSVTIIYVSFSLLAGIQQQVHELVSGMGIGNEHGE